MVPINIKHNASYSITKKKEIIIPITLTTTTITSQRFYVGVVADSVVGSS